MPGAVLDLLVQSLSIPGDIVECGTYKGGTAILMGLALKELGSDKKIHGFDSFAGLPSPDTEMDKGYKEGQFKSNLDRLREDLETFNLSDCVTLHPGWFADTVPPFLKQEPRRISLLHVDCDLYVSTNDCFPALYDVVEEGGAVILDDFNDGAKGEKRAVHEALEKAGRHEEIVIGPAPQAYFFKGGGDGDKTRYSLDDLIARKGYLKWISNHLETDYEAMLTDFQPS